MLAQLGGGLLERELTFDPGEQDRQVAGLDHIVVGAEGQGLLDHCRIAGGRQHNHRKFGLVEAQADGAQHLVTVHAGHLEVEQHEVEGLAIDLLQRLGAVGGSDDLVAPGPESERQRATDGGVVIYGEDAGG